MSKQLLCDREAFWSLPAALLVLSCAWTPARADIFVSHGAGGSLSNTVLSFSQYTGVPKETFTGGLVSSEGMAFGPDGNLYVADGVNKSVLRFNPSTGALIGTFVSPIGGIAFPFGITFGPDGSLYMADDNGLIRRFDGTSGAPTGTFSCAPPAGGTCYPVALTFGPDGNLYVSDSSSRGVLKLSGSTLALLGEFIAPMGSPTSTFPWGLHFGPNGNLYVAFSEAPGNTYDIFEFDASSGTQIAAFLATGLVNADFGFGPDQEIYAANNYGFQRFSSSTGSLLSTFGSGYNGDAGFFVMGGPGVLSVPPYLLYPPVTVNNLQTLRLTVVDGPVLVPPGVPVEAFLGFLNKAGSHVGPSKQVTLNPGQIATLDLDASTLIASGAIELRPTVVALPGTPVGGSLQGSAEVFTTSNGVGSVLYAAIPIPPSSNVTGPPSFVPQGVVYGQSMVITALAPPDSPCVALLSFADLNGNPVGPTLNVDLSPGTMTLLSFNANSITQPGGRQEFVPQIMPINGNPTGAPSAASACVGSAEVINQPSSAIATYQTSTPAIGTANANP